MKEKRKTRLNKTQGTKADFLGFGAFADTPTLSALSNSHDDQTSSTSSSPAKQQSSLRWSPIYTGKDEHLSALVFPRLIKRDATTKVKALQDLQDFFQKDDIPKKTKVDALAHYMFLYHSKLTYESSSSVRAEALVALTLAATSIPKAFQMFVQQNSRQILGMMFCAHGDPAAEVRAAANKYLSENQNNESQNDSSMTAYSLNDMQVGIWSYVERILSYGRSNKMYDDLFATSLKSSSSSSNEKSSKNKNDPANISGTNEDLNESKQDELEERFERIVATALTGMQVFIQRHGIVSNHDGDDIPTDSAFLWKNLSSPKISLRNRTYVLLAVACQRAPALIFSPGQSFSQTLPQALVAEKEASNVSALLEALLAYLVGYSIFHSNSSSSSPWVDHLNPATVTKSLVKIFKKSCYGASASQWGPTLLPILSVLPSSQDQVAVLSAAWKGRDETVRLGDHLVVVKTVSEAVSYFLLRKEKPESDGNVSQELIDNDGQPLTKVLAQLWLDCLKNFLDTDLNTSKSRNWGPVQQAHEALTKGLANELRKYDDACYDRPNCALYAIRDWFWSDRLHSCVLEAKQGSLPLAALLRNIMEFSEKTREPSSRGTHLESILREKFGVVSSSFQQSSGAVPTLDAYEFMIESLKYSGLQLFQESANKEDGILEKFLMNDVLRWLIIHTSSFSTQQQTKELARNDFILFGICLSKLQSQERRERLWGSLLKEVVAAKCRLDLFTAGLAALFSQDNITVDDVRCDALDHFAIQVVDEAVAGCMNEANAEDGNHHEEDDHNTTCLKDFLFEVSGLVPTIPALVRRPVISAWVSRVCVEPTDRAVPVPDPLLETLLKLYSTDALESPEAHRVLIQSWVQGGQVWENFARKMLLQEPTPFFEEAAKHLGETLKTWARQSDSPSAADVALLWSQKAWRLCELSKQSSLSHVDAPLPSMALVNLADLSIWGYTLCPDFQFSCLMNLLRNFGDSRERLKLFRGSADNNPETFNVAILMALSEASTGAISAARTSLRKDRCAQLLAALGGRSIGKGILESLLQTTVSEMRRITAKVESFAAEDCTCVRKAVALVSQLCDLMVDRAKPGDIFDATDDGEGLDKEFEREKIAKLIVPLHKEAFENLPWSSSYAELANVVISQCGVGSERGIGSLHYDMFQLIRELESRVLINLDADIKEEKRLAENVWLLSLSCGFGLNSPPNLDPQLIIFDPDKITAALLESTEARNTKEGFDANLDRAVFAWLIASSLALKDNALREKAVARLCEQSCAMLNSPTNERFCDDALLALRGVRVAQLLSKKHNIHTSNIMTKTLMLVLQCFTCKWESTAALCGVIGQDFDEDGEAIQSMQPSWRDLSDFPCIISLALTNDYELTVAAASECTHELVQALFIESKRRFSLLLMNAIAHSTSLLEDPTQGDSTTQRLSEWANDLGEEERMELEDDVHIASEILPASLRTELESWVDEEFSEAIDERIVTGRMFIWLCCLQFINAFVDKDSANRPSLVTYIGKSGALKEILNLTILHTGIVSDFKNREVRVWHMDEFLRTNEAVADSAVASTVFFRTIEALPSLSRRWWEEECPKVYATTIQDFIENNVAPVILQSELERLKVATIQKKFGSMSVTGSVTTREITATYSQDEIQLKVMIRLPSSFPLRNAEVDCSQTLGVSAKRWKLWSLQITLMLNNEGGTLQEALMLWKENVDKEFEGVEPCPVCYSVLHIKTHKLPELECTTCSNRFHSQCLTQWFKSSGKLQCVICQQPWSGTRVKK